MNIAVKPNTCVSSCPSNTYLSRDKCYPGFEFVKLIGDKERNYNRENPDFINEAYPEYFNAIKYPVKD